MSTTWDAQTAPRARRSARSVAVPPALAALGRALLFLAWAVLLAWAILVRPVRAFAQEVSGDAEIVVRSGDRVRVLSPALGPRRVEARVLGIRGDTLVLEGTAGVDGRQEARLVSVSSVHTLEMFRGTKSNAWNGAKIGAAVGAALGLMAGIVVMGSDEFPFQDAGAEAIPAGVLQGGLLGGLLGLGIGALSRSETWESIPPARIRVEPRPGGAAIVASLPLRL